jgi:hypothetical protein
MLIAMQDLQNQDAAYSAASAARVQGRTGCAAGGDS